MKDYKSILIKWLALNESGDETRKELFGYLHPEIKKGFDVITRIAEEELERNFSYLEFFRKIKRIYSNFVYFPEA